MDAAAWQCEESWSDEPASVSLARGFVVRHLEAHALPQLVFDVRLVVSELATNAVQHARTAFTVSLERSCSELVLRVGDGSCQLPAPAERGRSASSGRGLTIVGSYASDWGAELGAPGAGKQVWARFDLPARGDTSSPGRHEVGTGGAATDSRPGSTPSSR